MREQASTRPKGKGIAASDGSAFPLILEHYMLNSSSYEIPLRSMYALNCQTLPLSTGGLKESTTAKPAMQKSTEPLADAASQFKAQLISHISKTPHQFNLPVEFMVSFVRRAFAPTLENVDFPQALTALDYLKSLERRRKREIDDALRSLAIEFQSDSPFLRASQTQKEELQLTYPGVVRWVEAIEKKDRETHQVYKQMCMSLRRWTLLNEMWLDPFNKGNCMAMLNTLFPPAIPSSKAPHTALPVGELNPKELAHQRQGFFDYIGIVERDGRGPLETVLKSGARPGEETAWPMVHEFLDKYLDIATETIHECTQVKSRDYLEAELRGKTHRRNADSGVSFASAISTRSRTGSGSESSRSASPYGINRSKPTLDTSRPESPLNADDPTLEKTRSVSPLDPRQGKSTLERISHHLRKMRSRPEIKESGKAAKTLAKKKSLTTLVSGRSTSSSNPEMNFDVDEFKRKRMIWEANERKKALQTSAKSGRDTPTLLALDD